MCSTIALILAVSPAALAVGTDGTGTQTELSQAREYLMNYQRTETNRYGEEFTVEFAFDSEEELTKVAAYVIEVGYSAFEEEIEEAFAAKAKESGDESAIAPMSTDPSTGYAEVSGNGVHYVDDSAYGYVDFGDFGALTYQVSLGYSVTVEDGEITDVNNISFDITGLNSSGSWGDASFPSYHSGIHAGVTANYTITKADYISVGGISVPVKAESANEIFALLTTLVD